MNQLFYYIIFFGIIISGLVLGINYLNDPEVQFEYLKSQINKIELNCEEGFDGNEYGYTGKITFQKSIFGSMPPIGISDNTTEEHTEKLTSMLKLKISALPCYEKYVELNGEFGENQ